MDREKEVTGHRVHMNVPGDQAVKSSEPLTWASCFSAGMPSQVTAVFSDRLQGEFLFAPRLYAGDEEESLVSVAEAISEVVDNAGMDYTRPLLSCIVLAGAMCNLDGFKTRLAHELKAVFHDRRVRDKPDIKLYNVTEPQFAAWRGLAMLSPEFVHRDIWELEQKAMEKTSQLKRVGQLYNSSGSGSRAGSAPSGSGSAVKRPTGVIKMKSVVPPGQNR